MLGVAAAAQRAAGVQLPVARHGHQRSPGQHRSGTGTRRSPPRRPGLARTPGVTIRGDLPWQSWLLVDYQPFSTPPGGVEGESTRRPTWGPIRVSRFLASVEACPPTL